MALSPPDGHQPTAIDRQLRRIRSRLRGHTIDLPVAECLGEHLWRRSARRFGASHVTLPGSIAVAPGEVAAALLATSHPKVDDEAPSGAWEQRSIRIRANAPAAGGRSIDPDGPPSVAIGRTGTLYALRGTRTFANHADGTLVVPIELRHPEWARFAMEVRGYAAQRGGQSYQPYLHPDLRDIPSTHGAERFDLIHAILPIDRGLVLDLGANAGYFCHRFEECGFHCVAVERSVKEHYILRKHRDSMNRTFRIEHRSFEAMGASAKYDLVLALNIFHHFLKRSRSFEQLVGFLRRLTTTWLVLEPHQAGDVQLLDAEIRMTPSDLVEMVSREASLPHISLIGVDGGREVYLLGQGAP